MTTSDAMIRVSGLDKAFGVMPVLTGIDLAVPAGESAVIIGPAASGKSVLLKCIVGVYPPDAGHIAIGGQDLAELDGPEHAEVIESMGMLFQQGGLFDSMPVWENIAFKLIHRHGQDRAAAKARAIETLALVNLSADVADLYPADLSGGMQKRAGVARAIADQPNILLLDEPTAGLDPITTNQINAMIRHASDELGATVLAITSDMTAARKHYDRLFMLHEGRVIWSGRTDEIEAADNPYLQQMINGRAEGPISMRVRARA